MKTFFLTLSLALPFCGLPAFAADDQPMGRVTMIQGQAYVLSPNRTRRPLARNAQVHAGDILVTEEGTRMQVRMADTSVLGLHPDTELHLQAFAGASVSEPLRLRLVRGGFVTIAGVNPLRVESSLALIEGEGSAECFQDTQLYCAVYGGGLRLSNAEGELRLGVGANHDFAQVPTAGTAPIGLLSRPQELTGPDPGPSAVDSGGSLQGGAARSNVAPDRIPLENLPGFTEPEPIVVTPIKQ